MPKLIEQPTARPTRKVKAAGIGGLTTSVAILVINHFWPGAGEILGPEVAAGLTTLGAIVAGWFTKERAA